MAPDQAVVSTRSPRGGGGGCSPRSGCGKLPHPRGAVMAPDQAVGSTRLREGCLRSAKQIAAGRFPTQGHSQIRLVCLSTVGCVSTRYCSGEVAHSVTCSTFHCCYLEESRAGCFLDLLFDPEDGGSSFLRDRNRRRFCTSPPSGETRLLDVSLSTWVRASVVQPPHGSSPKQISVWTQRYAHWGTHRCTLSAECRVLACYITWYVQ
jgi:hypothetical protein